ncbi:glycogen/starch/alpha-glucan phosphorylase [Candidatus Methylocalor cossyra]|uniref:Alpha-1,4 glucan phosphorylase n=1 Tax=Candidatus Methylocalor cossyra TaxID=3108543 RepID=A0ABM9NKD7_9GAMM
MPSQSAANSALLADLPPLGLTPEDLASDIRRHFVYTLGRDRLGESPHYAYMALALAVRDRLMERWKNTQEAYRRADCRKAYYLSLEFLMGRTLSNAMLNLGITDAATRALNGLGLRLEEILDSEHDAGLGNGGLGRLAACFMDSCATLQLPVMGYGIRYEYGMFRQTIENGEQVEEPDHWLRNGHVWELERPELTVRVRFGGHTDPGSQHGRWVDTQEVLAVPYDIPIPGYRNGTVNTLRLWKAAATDEFGLNEFNAGDYTEAVRSKNLAENITMVLYPNDASENGKELRLRQQYFLASASLQDVVRQWVAIHGEDFSRFAEQHCFQLNDTHPSIAVAELMRLLVDEHHLPWEEAWSITTRTMAYTNHTLLPEALERWPVRLFRQLLPRLLEIIFEINARFLGEVAARWPGDLDRLSRMSLIEEGWQQQVRMAFLAIVGSFSVNGVAELHSNLLKQGLFRDFYQLWPHKFNNKTNGITPRRWLAACNPGLAALVTEAIGPGWVTDLSQLARLAPYADDAGFRERWRAVKRANKERLLAYKQAELGLWIDPQALFDTQVKRIHEYKRQLLNVLHVIHLYDRLLRGDTQDWTPRCVMFGGKAAPGYAMAKRIIKLINNVAAVINRDPVVGDRLKVAFLRDYRVSAMEIICPGTDLSEQISTAGKEASGTGNMKFMLNGALTIGTLDGANIEIREEVGADNFFLFGLTAEEVEDLRRHYDPVSIIEQHEDLRRVMDLLESGVFNRDEPGIFDSIIGSIRSPWDPWMTAADFPSYVEAQRRAAAVFRDQEQWTRMSILNCAASGKFSTDRTIAEYNRDIWKLEPVRPLS